MFRNRQEWDALGEWVVDNGLFNGMRALMQCAAAQSSFSMVSDTVNVFSERAMDDSNPSTVLR